MLWKFEQGLMDNILYYIVAFSIFRFLILTKCNICDYFVHKLYNLNLKYIKLVIDISCVIKYLRKV